jgi:DNA-binding response OmpR family regulator
MRRITIIDDDNDARNLLATFLRLNSFAVTIFSSGEEFISSGNSLDADAFIIDINLGGITGDKLCDRIKSNPESSKKPVLIISAHPEIEKLSSRACADAFLAKPFSRREVLNKMNLLLGESL